MAARSVKRTLVLGIGNILLRDDGVGVGGVEAFRDGYEMPASVECVDGGAGGAALSSLMRGFHRVIIVDAVRGAGPPGAVKRFVLKGNKGEPPIPRSAHGIGLNEALAVAAFEGVRPDAVLIGVEPFDTTEGMGLSPGLQRSVPAICRMIAAELKRHGVAVRKRRGDARNAHGEGDSGRPKKRA